MYIDCMLCRCNADLKVELETLVVLNITELFDKYVAGDGISSSSLVVRTANRRLLAPSTDPDRSDLYCLSFLPISALLITSLRGPSQQILFVDHATIIWG